MSTHKKVYISNLNYHTTEEELKGFLAETKAYVKTQVPSRLYGEISRSTNNSRINIFIPNYYVGFGTSRLKPLGIAYADLPTAEEAEEFIKEFEGKSFKDRKLKIRFHVPYAPHQGTLSRLSSVQSIKRLSRIDSLTAESKEENKENVEVGPVLSPCQKKYSENGIFVKGLRAKTSEDDLKEVFKEFNPTQIKIFKPRGWMRNLKQRSYNAIVTLDLPAEKTLDEVISSCTGEKCCGNTITVVRAYVNADRELIAKTESAETEPASSAQVTGSEELNSAGDEVALSPEEVLVSADGGGSSKESSVPGVEQENGSDQAILEGKNGAEAKAEAVCEA